MRFDGKTLKGVEIRHRNVTKDDYLRRLTLSLIFRLKMCGHCIAHSLLMFRSGKMFGALLCGGRLVIVPYLISRSPEEFSKLVNEEHITILNQTPTAFTRFSESSIRCSLSLPKLRAVIFGGEALNIASLSGWYDTYGKNQAY
ncbi:AMP-binding protein [Vibrio sp. PP-XX7]